MIDPVVPSRVGGSPLSEAVRAACLAEATAKKVGNVHPDAAFDDLTHEHFCIAGDILAERLDQTGSRLADRMLAAVRRTVQACGTNVNLGIVLLVSPLFESIRLNVTPDRIVRQFTPVDGGTLMKVISSAGAGGLGNANEMDVRDAASEIDILAAMEIAKDRDRVARQYAMGFIDVIDVVEPMLARSIQDCGDLHLGVVDAQLQLLAEWPDSLIARKCGIETAMNVCERASVLDRKNADDVAQFDHFLRSDGHRLNPGTTADLIAAGLFWHFAKPD